MMKNKIKTMVAVAAITASTLVSATPVFAATTTLDFGTFTNTYTADSVSLSLSGKKTLTDASKSGKTLAGDDFSFQLVDSTGKVVETVKNKADGTIKFSDLTYTTPGTYTYTIKEVAGTDKHITYDKSIKTVTVTVTGENGVLSVNAEAGVQTQAETSEKPVEGN